MPTIYTPKKPFLASRRSTFSFFGLTVVSLGLFGQLGLVHVVLALAHDEEERKMLTITKEDKEQVDRDEDEEEANPRANNRD